jgi:hypothetical protein
MQPMHTSKVQVSPKPPKEAYAIRHRPNHVKRIFVSHTIDGAEHRHTIELAWSAALVTESALQVTSASASGCSDPERSTPERLSTGSSRRVLSKRAPRAD